MIRRLAVGALWCVAMVGPLSVALPALGVPAPFSGPSHRSTHRDITVVTSTTVAAYNTRETADLWIRSCVAHGGLSPAQMIVTEVRVKHSGWFDGWRQVGNPRYGVHCNPVVWSDLRPGRYRQTVTVSGPDQGPAYTGDFNAWHSGARP